MTTAARPHRPAEQDLVMGRYRLEERSGVGGSAEVWRGFDERLRRPVAIKVLHPHLLRDETARRRFEREARAAAALSHPGIVAVYDIDASAEGSAIVLELVEGETLAQRLARGPVAPAEAARIGVQLAEALQHAHERGVVHRDVKPGNVLLGQDGRARLADFGIARVLEAEAAALTTADVIPGTLRYLAPERLAGSEAAPSADIYALGVLLYEMVAGHPPFEAASPLALAKAQERPPAAVPAAPPQLAAVWRDALQPDPQQRPRDAAAMAARLRAIARPIRAMAGPARAPLPTPPPATASAGADDVTVALAPSAEAMAAPIEAGWPLTGASFRRRPRWAAAAVPVAGIALAGIVVAALAGQFLRPNEPTSAPVVVASPTATATGEPSATVTPNEQPSAGDNGNGKGKGKGRD